MATTSNGSEQEPTVAVARILIVEDDLAIARATERLIRRVATTAVEVVAVDTGEAAMARLTSSTFDAVISDCNLAPGGATGLDVLAASRALPNPPRFLFLTSDERCEGRGVPWLQKPASPSELRAAIAKLLDVDQPKVVKEMPLDYSHAFDVGGEA